MPLFKLRIPADDLDAGGAAANLLTELEVPRALAVTLFESGPARFVVEAYYDARPSLAAVTKTLSALVGGLGEAALEAVPDQNWVALSQAALPPVAAGRFLVHGRHDRARVGARRTAIEIEAGEAFGTGHNATTALCLEALDGLTRRRRFENALDLGCGSGVLAIAAARVLPSARVLAVDNDPLATAIARENARLNGAGATSSGARCGGVRAPAASAGGRFRPRARQPPSGSADRAGARHATGTPPTRCRRAVGPARPPGTRGRRTLSRRGLPPRITQLPCRMDRPDGPSLKASGTLAASLGQAGR